MRSRMAANLRAALVMEPAGNDPEKPSSVLREAEVVALAARAESVPSLCRWTSELELADKVAGIAAVVLSTAAGSTIVTPTDEAAIEVTLSSTNL